ncbi:MAG: Ig-like domain-containing protein [Cyclobacteriaceae bacterium]|nr:Ig-like domain-containing protein [Cyclobacteriaceae bacterium]
MKKVLLFFLALTFYYSYSFADAPPTVTVTAATAGPTNNTNIVFNIEFSENVTGFTNDLATDLDLSTTTGGTLLASVVAIDGNSYTVTITGQTGTGTITLGVRAGAAVNGTTEGNTATATAQTIYDGVAPTITSLVKKASQTDPTNTSPVLFTITFSEPINVGSFTTADVSTTGTTAAGASVTNVAQVAPNDGTTFEITVGSITGSGNVVVGLNASVITDPAGNNNTASTTATVVFDNNPPDITSITKEASQDDPTNVGPILFIVVFDEPITGFTTTDINLAGTSTGGLVTNVAQVAPNDGTTWEVTVSGMTTDGTIIIDLPANRVQDAAGNNNTASVTASVTLDTDNPDISTSTPGNGAVNVSVSNNITFTFDEAIRNIDDSPINNSNISSIVSLRVGSTSGSVVASTITISGNTATIDPTSNLAGSTQFFVVILPVEDNANNATASPNINFSFTTIDSTPPTVSDAFTPADGSTDVATDTDLSFVFSENVVFSSTSASGNEDDIRIMQGGSTVETITRGDSRITITGNTITINPTTELSLGLVYHLRIGDKVFADASGNNFSGFDDNTTWNFTTTNGVTITAPNGGACTGTFSNIGAIILTENAGSNIDGPAGASRTLVLQINGTGFQFKPCSGAGCSTVTASFTANRDIDATSVNATSVTFTTATFTIPFENGNSKNEIDVITINGLQITTDNSSPSATIVKSASSTLNIQGITNGSTVLANLSNGAQPSAPTLNPLGQTIVFCQNDAGFSSAQLTVTGSNVRWYSDAGLTMQVATGNTVTIGSGLSVNGAVSGDYTRYVTQNTGGCESSALSVPIRINLNPIANAGIDQTICSDATLAIGGTPTLQVASNGSTYSYSWASVGLPSVGSITSISNPTVDFPANTDFPPTNRNYTIRVTITDNLGCSDTDDVVISVRPQINAFLTKPGTFNFSPTTPAQDLEANPPGGIFTGIGVVQSGPSTYRFDPPTANSSNSDPLPNNFEIFYTFTDGNGCTNNSALPIATFTLSNSFFTDLLPQYCSDELPYSSPGVGGVNLQLSSSSENDIISYRDLWNTNYKQYQNKLYFAPDWNALVNYSFRQVVRYAGQFYAAKGSIIGNLLNQSPNLDAANWEQQIMNVEYSGTIRNYYEGIYGGNAVASTVQKQLSNYIVNGRSYPNYKFYTNSNYINAPDFPFNEPGVYLNFVNPRDLYYYIADWSLGWYYYQNSVVTYNGSIYRCIKSTTFSLNEQPDLFPAFWENVTNQSFDLGYVYQRISAGVVVESGFLYSSQFVIVNKIPTVSFSGLNGPINPNDFCQTNTSIEIKGSRADDPNPNKGTFLISLNGAPETNSLLGFSNTSPGFASFNPLTVATGNLGSNNNVTITYVYDPGTDGSTGQACSGISSRNIVINTPPAFTFVNPTPAESTDFCFEGASVTLQTDQISNVTFSGFGTSIQVAGFQASFNPASAFNSASGPSGATRTITVNAQFTDSKGCTNTISRNFDVLPKPNANFTPSFGDPDDVFYCYGDPQITFNGNTLVEGQSSTKFFIKFLGQTTLDPDLEVDNTALDFDPSVFYDAAVLRGQNPLNDAQFRVTYQIIDNNNCSSSIFKTYTVSPSIQVSINNLADNEVYCSNQIKTITFNPFPAESAKRNLKFNNVTQTITSNSFTIPASTPTSTTNVTIEYEVIGGTDCATTVTKTATVLRSPIADFAIDPTAPRCVDIPVEFNAITTGNGADAIYLWTLQDINESGTNLTTVERTYNASNQYNTALRVEYPPVSGVTCFDQTSDLTTIGNNPIVSFNFANVCNGDGTNFFAITTQAVAIEYQWKFGGAPITGFGNSASPVSFPPGTSGTFAQPIYSFTPGDYIVEVIAKTANNCTDTLTRTVSILNKVTVADNNIYAMLNTNGNWVPENLSLGNDSSTWAFANPNGTRIGVADNLEAWVTNATGPYKANDQSVVNSPCFNLNGLSKPVLSIDYWSDTRSGLDGAFLQFSTDGGATWQLLGARNTGIQWYNAIGISSVGSAPGNPLALGWSFEQPATQNSWLEAKHSIEEIPAGSRSNVRFRIRFTSNPDTPKSSLVDENRLVDGFAFRNVKIESRNRTILSENFTNENAANFAQNNLNFDIYGSASTTDLIKIQYHSSIGGEDEINSRNSSDPDARTAFYGVTQGLRGYIDGFSGGNFTTNSLPWASDYFSLRSLVTSPVNINISTPAVVDGKWQFENTVNILSDLNPSFQYAVFTAIINKNMDGTNKNVLRKLLPNAAGVRLTSLTAGQTQVIPISYDLFGIDQTEYGNLAIVTFVQKINGDKDVLQSTYLDGFTITGNIISSIDYPIDGMVNVYPNPADKSVIVKLKEAVKENVELTLTDSFGIRHQLGTLKKGQNQIETNVEKFAPGLYIIQLKTGAQTFLQKVIIER